MAFSCAHRACGRDGIEACGRDRCHKRFTEPSHVGAVSRGTTPMARTGRLGGFVLRTVLTATFAALALAGCGNAPSNQIQIVGSSTVYPFTTARPRRW